MRYNSTYTPVMNLKTTIQAIANLREMLVTRVRQIFDFIKVTPPLFFSEDSELLINLNHISRLISFDTLDEYKIGCLTLSHTNWMRKMIDRLDLDFNQGLESESTLIWRDLEELPTNSITKHELVFQIKINQEDDIAITKKISKKIYQIIFELATYVHNHYKINNIYPSQVDFISSQMLEHELPNESPKNRELEFAIQKESFILVSGGMKLFSGKRHSDIPPYLYDLKNSYQIVMRDRINSLPIKVATITLLANGHTLKDQLMLYDYEKLLATEFYQDLTKKTYKIIEIKINLPRLMMALLGKGHIAEVQAGIISHEVKQIKEKFDIEVI